MPSIGMSKKSSESPSFPVYPCMLVGQRTVMSGKHLRRGDIMRYIIFLEFLSYNLLSSLNPLLFPSMLMEVFELQLRMKD